MPSQSQGRTCLILALFFAALFLVLRFQYSYRYSSASSSASQYALSSSRVTSSIANATLGFEKILVINAPWRTDRKDAISLAAGYSGIDLEFIDGIEAETIREKAYPPGNHRQLSDGLKGSWRAHMNALRTVIEQNLTTAMIMEDDVDWDFRIRSQLSNVSPAIRHLPDLIARSEQQAPKHTPNEKLSQADLAKGSSLPIDTLSTNNIPKLDPYGQGWDILWLGHCGAALPPASPHSPNRIIFPDDLTVPEPQNLRPMPNAPLDVLGTLYPPHTRLLHQANNTLCTIAYAVTQRGARKLLYQHAVKDLSQGYDFALSDFCNGKLRDQTKETTPMCIVANPPILSHYFAEKAGSDIVGVGAGGKPEEGSRYVRWSVRMNMERLVKGEDGIEEQWPDSVGKGEV